MSEQTTSVSAAKGNPTVTFLSIMTGCYAVSFFGSQGAMMGLGDWYSALRRPSWAPESWQFTAVWTLVYGLMGLAAWQIWTDSKASRGARKGASAIFLVQLLLNGAWPWAFFSAKHPELALYVSIAGWVFSGLTTMVFFRLRLAAGLAMLPTWLWLGYQCCFCYAVLSLNR